MHPQRRSYSKSFKAQVIQECAEPGASIANIALGYNLNANLVHKWIRLHTQKTTALQPAFIPLHTQMLSAGSQVHPSSICLEIQHPRTPIKMSWPVDSAAACASFLRELLR
ncbi:IS66-like element accessory protein TnpA [Pseudomonas sp. CT11-2]|uniref:Transposase n=1 Tax=Pseudomonas chlororaphis TaxID=587753 RepID=A0A0G3GJI2_9PSED|nr:transposase [Pseudomonas chlororaphis]